MIAHGVRYLSGSVTGGVEWYLLAAAALLAVAAVVLLVKVWR